jgi:hypothetical protein
MRSRHTVRCFDEGLRSRRDWNVAQHQPVIPFGVRDSTNMILRVIVPMTSQPGSDGTRVNGLGDIVMTAFFRQLVATFLFPR